MNKKVSQQDSKKKRRKLGFWWWSLGAVLTLATLVTCSLSFPLNNSGVASSASTSPTQISSTPSVSQLSMVAVEVSTMPSKLNYNATETISTSGGILRVVLSDYSVRYVAMNDAMIDQSRIDLSRLGTTNINVRYSFNDVTLFTSYQINVVSFDVAITKVSLDVSDVNIITDQVVTLKYLLEPTNGSIDSVVWTSNNPLIASVDEFGNVSGKSIGSTTINVSINGSFTASARVNIVAPTIAPPNTGFVNRQPSEPSGADWIPIASIKDLDMIRYENVTYTFAEGTNAAVSFTDNTPGMSGKYYLLNNINFTGFNNSGYEWAEFTRDSNSFMPLGFEDLGGFVNYSLDFTGEFDGNNKSINNMVIKLESSSDYDYVGLFSSVSGAEIYDLSILNAVIEQDSNYYDYVGVLAGLATPDTLIDNVDVSGTITADDFAGGLVGVHAIQVGGFGSTPFIFTRDGQGNFNYANELGMFLPLFTNPNDFAVLDSDKLALQNDGSYHINITNEFNEISYLDEVNLMVFDHDQNYQLTNSMLRSDQLNNLDNFKLVPNNLLPIVSAFDQFGNDVTLEVSTKNDGLWTSFADESSDFLNEITLDLGDLSNLSSKILILNSIVNYDFENVSLIKFIEILDNNNNWINAATLDNNLRSQNLILPVAMPRPYFIDLTTAFNNVVVSEYKIKIGFNRVIYDFIAVSDELSSDYSLTILDPDYANLDYRGFSKVNLVDNPYKTFDYYSVKQTPYEPYAYQSGYFTKYGDVLPLLENKDDYLAILRYGDQVELKFNANEVNSGLKRSFAIHGAIWYKHAERQNGTTVNPIPFSGMTSYPYIESLYPTQLQDYINTWNTRYYAPRVNNTIQDSVSSVVVNGYGYLGGLVGYNEGRILRSSATGNVTGDSQYGSYVGGLVGATTSGTNYNWNALNSELTDVGSTITDSFATGDVIGGGFVGGLIGSAEFTLIKDSYSEGDVFGYSSVGGLVGELTANHIDYNSVSLFVVDAETKETVYPFNIDNVHATGNVNRIVQDRYSLDIGGLVGYVSYYEIKNANATGNVFGDDSIGGLIGNSYNSNISNSNSTGDVESISQYSGGLIGYIDGESYFSADELEYFSSSISESYATGNVVGIDYVGGLVGFANDSLIYSSYSSGQVLGVDYVGGLIGYLIGDTRNDVNGRLVIYHYLDDTESTSSVEANDNVGGLIGYATGYDIGFNNSTNIFVKGRSFVGGLIGYGFNINLYNASSNSFVEGNLNVGGIIGEVSNQLNNDVVFDSLTATGFVKGITVDADINIDQIGGVIGSLKNISITRAIFEGVIDITTEVDETAIGIVNNVGGIVGFIDSDSTNGSLFRITESAAFTSIAINSDGQVDSVGGLIGKIYKYSIEESFSTGLITIDSESNSDFIAGLVGSIFNSSLSDSYAVVEVNITSTVLSLGGLIGLAQDTEVSRTYYLGELTYGSAFNSGTSVGVFIGEGIDITVQKSYYLQDSDVNNGLDAIGDITGDPITEVNNNLVAKNNASFIDDDVSDFDTWIFAETDRIWTKIPTEVVDSGYPAYPLLSWSVAG
jgi:hypothetical protein